MTRLFALALFFVSLLPAAPAGEVIEQARRLEESGNPSQARSVLAQAAAADPESAVAYAEFLDRYGDPGRKEAYLEALEALGMGGARNSENAGELRIRLNRRLALISLAEGDRSAAQRHVDAYREAGGTGMEQAAAVLNAPEPTDQPRDGWAKVPGPLLGFRRMAALSSDQAPEDLVYALSRNTVTSGYRATAGGDSLAETEFLKLILQYLSQARELEQFAGANQTLNVPTCESRETAQLLKVLGFRLRNECGPEAVLETVNPSRAFLSIDSGFPLADLEIAFREGRAFEMPYRPTYLPVVFGTDYWLGITRKKVEGGFIESLLRSPDLARLYVALSKMHRPTGLALREKIDGDKLLNMAHVLDFFGSRFETRNGQAVLPGGPRTKNVWEKLVGVSPDQGAEFFQRLVELDDGWLASYYDSLGRASGVAADYFNEPRRLERFYLAVRGKVTSPGPARPVFRANSELMLLTARTHFNADGTPHMPGGIEPWKKLFVEHPHGEYDGRLTKSAANWSTAEDVLESMFGLCRKMVENQPLRMFMAVSSMARSRDQPLSASMVSRIVLAFPDYGDQLSLFNEAPTLSEETMAAFFDLGRSLDKIGNNLRRADAVGSAQALFGLWQILLRQGQIPSQDADRSLRALIDPFRDVKSHQSIFEASRAGVRTLLSATGSPDDAPPQERLVELLAGKPGPNDDAAYAEVVKTLDARFQSQRLVSVKDVFDLADHLERVSRGEPFNVAMANRLAARISEVRLPRSNLSREESTAFAQGNIVERHIAGQRRLNLNRAVDRARGRPDKLLDIRGRLAPILRDSLVGLNYIYYSPPGAELIRANPLFVRSHDFLGPGQSRTWRVPRLAATGWPNSGGGRLVGSLSGLPFALAHAEQNFMVPTERQALIWQDLAPQILIGATVPRWWNLKPADQHFVGLHLRWGEELLAHAAVDEAVWTPVRAVLRGMVEPARVWRVEELSSQGRVDEGIAELTPSEIYHLAVSFGEQHGAQADSLGGPFRPEIERLRQADPDAFSYERVASLFGTPHPELSHSYRRELLRLPLFPTMMKYSSRILAESWESTNLYWAALADELHLAPSQLNLLIPEWTQRSLERIFATNLDDWPALLHSMRVVGERYREQLRPRAAAPMETGSE